MEIIILVFSIIFMTLIFLISIILSANKEYIWNEVLEKIEKKVEK